MVDISKLPKHQVFVVIRVHNMRERQQGSGRFKLHKRLLHYKHPAKNATLSFSVFSLFQFRNDF